MHTHASSTCKAGRGWDRQLGLPATSIAGEGARSHVELVVSSLASDVVATSLDTLSVAYNRRLPEEQAAPGPGSTHFR